MEQVRTIFVSSLTALAAYLSPIHDILWVIMWLFIINLIFGLMSGLIVHDEKFQTKKALFCLLEVALFYVIVSAIFTVGDHMGNKDSAIQAISMVTYSFIYLYSVNILKNMTRLAPGSKILAFLYYVLSVEFIKKVPYLKSFQETVKLSNNEN